MKAGAYYEWVNNSQPGNGDSNGRLIPASWGADTTGNYFADMLTGNARRVRRAVAERRPRHGLQHLRGLHPGQLEGEQPADRRRRPPPVAPGRLVRAQRRRHGGVRSRALQLAGARHDVPRPHLDGHQPDIPTSGVEVQGLFVAARRLRLRPLGRRLDAAPRRLRHVQLPRRAGAVLRLHRPALRRDVHQRRRQPAAVATSRTSTRTRSPASAARSCRPTTSSRGPRAGASRCSGGCRIR